MFPGLDRSRSGDGLEARFNAFKIPESNFLVFEATVRTCRDGCQPVSASVLNVYTADYHKSCEINYRPDGFWGVQCATSRKVTGSIPDGVTGIFH